MEAALGVSSYICLLKETLTLVCVVETLWFFSRLLAIQRARSVVVFRVFSCTARTGKNQVLLRYLNFRWSTLSTHEVTSSPWGNDWTLGGLNLV
jgi:hypothetical protein